MPVQLPNAHVKTYSFSSITSFPSGVVNLKPSLHLNRAFMPCSVFGARTIPGDEIKGIDLEYDTIPNIMTNFLPNFGGFGKPLHRAGVQRGIILQVPFKQVGGCEDVIGNS